MATLNDSEISVKSFLELSRFVVPVFERWNEAIWLVVCRMPFSSLYVYVLNTRGLELGYLFEVFCLIYLNLIGFAKQDSVQSVLSSKLNLKQFWRCGSGTQLVNKCDLPCAISVVVSIIYLFHVNLSDIPFIYSILC